MVARLTLVLGGARSGKSRHAEALLEATSANLIYLATATARDAEMTARITQHRQRRGDRWRTIEEPIAIAQLLQKFSEQDAALVDCLTLWLTNLMMAKRDIETESTKLLDALQASPASIVLVSNEVGLGGVSMNAMARAFTDHAGILHQRIAAIADRVIFMAAGLPLILKSPASG
ncbi:MAG: bifunctional adenosylcobinamide kinase/adenosylcobinamide-phosphate guanylyltransferase [Pseudomonadota bacterium]